MVKRYDSDMYGEPLEESDSGYWVHYDDYAALQSALKEALDGWQEMMREGHNRWPEYMVKEWERIAELRKLL